MQCPSCKSENDENAKFCGECGGRLAGGQPANVAVRIQPAPSPSPLSVGPAAQPSSVASPSGERLRMGATMAPWLETPGNGLVSSPAGTRCVSIPKGLEDFRGSNDSGTLNFPQRRQFGRAHLFGTGTLKLGRVPSQNDVTLFVLPLTPQNESLTRAISSRHFEVVLDGNGLTLNDKSRFGTLLNGQKVAGSASIPLDQVSEVEVALSLKLRIVPFVKQVLPLGQDPYPPLGAADDVWTTAARLGIGGVMVERSSNAAVEECYVMVFTWVALGPAFDGGPDLPPVDGGRVRIVRARRAVLGPQRGVRRPD